MFEENTESTRISRYSAELNYEFDYYAEERLKAGGIIE